MAIDAEVGASFRAEADQAQHRTIFFAVVLVLAHLLDVRPSEVDAAGLKFTLKDPAILYGALALVFGYYLSKFLSNDEKRASFHPLNLGRRRMRSYIRVATRNYLSIKNNRKNPISYNKIKGDARNMVRVGFILLIPYRVISALFVVTAIVFSGIDLYSLSIFIWKNSSLLAAFRA